MQVLTVSCKIQVSAEQSAKLDALSVRFAEACNWINENTPSELKNQIAMQALIYHEARLKFELSANLTIQAVRRVCGNRKTAGQKGKKVKAFKPGSVSYDARTFAFREKDWTVTLTTLSKRERFDLAIGNYQRSLLSGAKSTSAMLVKRQSGEWYVQVQIKSEPPVPGVPVNVIGIDFGRTDIAVTSSGELFSGQEVKQVRDRYANLRANLQAKASKGTRSTRRRTRSLLKRLSGKEKRFQALQNHTISKRIIIQAVRSKSAVAIEDLTGIRERTNQQSRGKTERRRSNSWAFYQLRQFMAYKAIGAGIKLILVSPAYTSQTCHCCNHIGLRSGKRFKCSNCEWHGDADLNGAINIQKLGRILATPGGSDLSCSLSRDDSGLLKSPSSKRLSA
jgi:putative transposase